MHPEQADQVRVQPATTVSSPPPPTTTGTEREARTLVHDRNSLRNTGFTVGDFQQYATSKAADEEEESGSGVQWGSTVPVFTMSSAVEGRKLLDEGFLLVRVAERWEDWLLLPHIYTVPDQGGGGHI
jgi:hypothetical protein